MRAGLIIYGSLDTLSGGYLYDRHLVNFLEEAGDEVEIISLPWSRYQHHILHNARPSLEKRLRHGRFDILLQDELNHPSLYRLNEHLRRRGEIPVVSIVHHLRSSEDHPEARQAGYRRIERRYLQTVDGFIFNSETTREATETLSGVVRPHVIAYPAADHIGSALGGEQVRARAAEPGPLRLIFVGNIIPRKGLHMLLAALVVLSGDWQLAIVGDPAVNREYSGRLRKWVGDSRLADRVTWHGRLSNDALRGVMSASDLLVVPSSYEGFGIVYLEGMAFGLPALAATSGAAREVISDGVTGFLVGPFDAAALAARIGLLQRDRVLLQRMSLAALARYRAFPTWAQSMSAVRRFLLQMRR